MGGAGTALVAGERPEVVGEISRTLRALGWEIVGTALEPREAESAVAVHAPDIVVVGVCEGHNALDLVEAVSRLGPTPVIAALPEDDPRFVAEAAERGIAAFTGNLGREGLEAAIEMGRTRHRDHRSLRDQIEGLERRLHERAQIEQARGVLMERHQLDNRSAYERIRARAREERTTVLEIACAVLDGRARP